MPKTYQILLSDQEKTRIMNRIEYDWNDAKATQILRAVRAATPATGKLLLVELVVDNANDDLSPGTFASVHFKLPRIPMSFASRPAPCCSAKGG